MRESSMAQQRIRKVIIPAAGLGTRFLPITKAIPKEMLPIGNVPALHIILQEAVAAGMTDICLIINEHKQAIQDYFTPVNHAVRPWSDVKNQSLIESLEKLLSSISIHYIFQQKPAGLGDAILHARDYVGDEYCAVMLPDDLIRSATPAIGELAVVAASLPACVLAVQEVPRHKVSSYGIISTQQRLTDTVFLVNDVVEKPSVEKAPSALAIVGRYIFSPDIFVELAAIKKVHTQGELQLTDAIARLIKKEGKVLATTLSGVRYDTGTPLGWLEANNGYILHQE